MSQLDRRRGNVNQPLFNQISTLRFGRNLDELHHSLKPMTKSGRIFVEKYAKLSIYLYSEWWVLQRTHCASTRGVHRILLFLRSVVSYPAKRRKKNLRTLPTSDLGTSNWVIFVSLYGGISIIVRGIWANTWFSWIFLDFRKFTDRTRTRQISSKYYRKLPTLLPRNSPSFKWYRSSAHNYMKGRANDFASVSHGVMGWGHQN